MLTVVVTRLLLVALGLSTACFSVGALPTAADKGSNIVERDQVREESGANEKDKDLDNDNEVKKMVKFPDDLIPLNSSMDIPEWVDDWLAPKEVRNWFPFYVTGYDEEGAPVYVLEYGHWMITEALNKGPGGREKMKDLLIKYMQQAVLRALRDGRSHNNQGIGVIFDWDGFTLANYADPYAIEIGLRQFAHLNQLYHVLKYVFLINTNFAAENFLALAKPFLGNVLEKCEIFGTQRPRWLPHVLRRVPKSELAPWYGGPQDWRPVWIGGSPLNITKSQ